MIVGIGIDLVAVDRLKRVTEKFGDRFLTRVFTEQEIQYCHSRFRSFQHYAVRFAAKEAFLKAIGTGLAKGISWQEMEIVNNSEGKPCLVAHGKCKEILQELTVDQTLVSLSHTADHGIAIVILERD